MTAALIAAAVLLALLQVTWLASLQVLPALLVLGTLTVDVVPATLVATVAGLTLDLLGVHAFGVSSALVGIAIVAGTEALRLVVRRIEEHLALAAAILVALVDAFALLVTGRILELGLLGALWNVAFHVALAVLLLIPLRGLGERYREHLRERGVM